tara:strand:- start:2126 stop:3178 length:1053 start_codon:yes stop_codon:yes gene_type:complete
MPKIPDKGLYRMPAEWERQKSTWIAWPHNKEDWPGKFTEIPWVFAEIITILSKVQSVNVLVKNKSDQKTAVFFLKILGAKIKNIEFIACKTDRAWARDFLPIFLKDKKNKNIISNWEFNGWAKYKNFKNDNKAYLTIKRFKKIKIIKPKHMEKKIVLEGGSIDVNGDGLILTTKQCLLSKIQQRNKGFKINDYNQIFDKFFGVKKVIWLNKGIQGDDTHGHIDDIARFISKNKIFIAKEKNKKDVNFKNLDENIRIVKEFKKTYNQKLEIVYLPMPKPKFIDGIRVPASYLNFYIANKLVLVPSFGDLNDKIVIKIFKKHFKNRKIIPINCSALVWGLGTLHCMTQQEPI